MALCREPQLHQANLLPFLGSRCSSSSQHQQQHQGGQSCIRWLHLGSQLCQSPSRNQRRSLRSQVDGLDGSSDQK